MNLKKIWSQPGAAALIAAAILLVLTLGVGLWPVSNHNGTGCGSWIASSDSAAREADRGSQTKVNAILGEYGSSYNKFMGEQNTSEQRSCSDARSTMTIPVTVLSVLTLAALVVGVLQRYRPARAPSQNP